MLSAPTSRSPDLQRLVKAGYEVSIRANHLVVSSVPYVNADREIKRGALIARLVLEGDRAARPDTHVMMVSGEYPCHQDGRPIEGLRYDTPNQRIDDNLVARFAFSNKPAGGYVDYFHQFDTYAHIFSGPAQALDSSATPRTFFALFRNRRDQALVELALRQQLEVFTRRHRRPRLSPLDRAFWVALVHLWPRWRQALVVVKPDTVIRWHREGFRRYWRSISVPGPGRPRISEETRDLIIRMAVDNGWRARRIQGELLKLGVRVSLATISRYLPKIKPDPHSQQRLTCLGIFGPSDS